MDTQIADFGEEREPEWLVDRILSHVGSGENATFEVKWRAGDITWLPYAQVSQLDALGEYLDSLGFTKISELTDGQGTPP